MADRSTSDTSPRTGRAARAGAIALATALIGGTAGAGETDRSGSVPPLRCAPDQVMATGRPDPTLFDRAASGGVRARWCERYDAWGRSTRSGPYREVYPNGRLRTRARYVDSRLEGPVRVWHENGRPFLQGRLDAGDWDGPFALFHENGAPWWVAHFRSGHLEGVVRSYFPDGALESEAHFQAGREDGLARSFYPRRAGGGLKSETRIEADLPVGAHRLFARDGRLRKVIRGGAPPDVRPTTPAAPRDARPSGRTPAAPRDARPTGHTPAAPRERGTVRPRQIRHSSPPVRSD